uniref:Uncharacterized protein n=1 Tax=Caenorhabditis japonica TaxID=281687 RepID=A0A8R1HLI2_CAEJA
MNTVLIFSLLIVGVLSQFPIDEGEIHRNFGGVSAFDGESCAKCHYPNQCIDRRCVPRGVERHLVNKCSYGADCGRGHWICFEGKCIKLQPEEEKNFY